MMIVENIGSDTGVQIGLVATIVILTASYVADRTATRHRLRALEDLQEKDNKWRQEHFLPWRRKVDRSLDRLTSDPDAAQSRTWPKTDDR